MTNQELFEALHKSQIKAKRLMRKNKKLKRRFNKLNRALDKACEELHSNGAWYHYGNMSKKCGLSKEEWKKELMEDVD